MTIYTLDFQVRPEMSCLPICLFKELIKPIDILNDIFDVYILNSSGNKHLILLLIY